MLNWSFIVMQRDEACSQMAESVKRLIFQTPCRPIIKNHYGSYWVSVAGDPDFLSWNLSITSDSVESATNPHSLAIVVY